MQKIGILMGGFSSEREVSLKSGFAVEKALSSLGYQVSIIDFNNVPELYRKLRSIKADCIFNALHGRFGEDGGVQEILDEFKIPYTGSGVRASVLAMDKIASRKIFAANQIPVPEYQVFDKKTLKSHGLNLEFPVVVKPVKEGSSIGLSIAEDPAALFIALKNAFAFDNEIVVEKYINGREITVGILEDNPLPVIEIVPKNKFYDFQAKYTPGMCDYIVPADLPLDTACFAQATALKAHKLLGCRCFSRVDIILDSGGCPVVLEVNTIPGFTATSLLPKAAAACGIDFPRLCRMMIVSALKLKFKEFAS
ncbi:MAG: D-alanine--D-alanine ligase [Candidatus Omnitrophica bacterium]|nr:D-alanine--D-alanine ligase [Candidatus Omnitrophota bacterium]